MAQASVDTIEPRFNEQIFTDLNLAHLSCTHMQLLLVQGDVNHKRLPFKSQFLCCSKDKQRCKGKKKYIQHPRVCERCLDLPPPVNHGDVSVLLMCLCVQISCSGPDMSATLILGCRNVLACVLVTRLHMDVTHTPQSVAVS